MEQWRDIPGYESQYQVSDQGRVRTLKRTLRSASVEALENSVMKFGYENHGGRRQVTLCKHGKIKRFLVHRLVLLAFTGPAPEDKPVARHLNGDYLDNRPENLAWGTMQENANDAARHGTRAKGEQLKQSALTETQVREIRAARGLISQKELAQKYGISQVAVSCIMTRRTWKHVV